MDDLVVGGREHWRGDSATRQPVLGESATRAVTQAAHRADMDQQQQQQQLRYSGYLTPVNGGYQQRGGSASSHHSPGGPGTPGGSGGASGREPYPHPHGHATPSESRHLTLRYAESRLSPGSPPKTVSLLGTADTAVVSPQDELLLAAHKRSAVRIAMLEVARRELLAQAHGKERAWVREKTHLLERLASATRLTRMATQRWKQQQATSEALADVVRSSSAGMRGWGGQRCCCYATPVTAWWQLGGASFPAPAC